MTPSGRRSEKGAGLIVVILIAAFLAIIGLSLLTLTGMGPKISGGMRSQEEAFNAAEAGFDAVWTQIEGAISGGQWVNFSGRTLNQPAGIDLPMISGAVNTGYFRRLSDDDLFRLFDPGGDGTPDVPNLLAFHQTFAVDGTGAVDPRLTYTAFLIDDEAGGGSPDPEDALLVVIGAVRAATRIIATSRLEIVLALQD